MTRLSDRLREAVEEEIATGKLLPGSRLDEVELAKRFEVSRTPIREALNLLLGEGLIEMRPRRGAVVARVAAAADRDVRGHGRARGDVCPARDPAHVRRGVRRSRGRSRGVPGCSHR